MLSLQFITLTHVPECPAGPGKIRYCKVSDKCLMPLALQGKTKNVLQNLKLKFSSISRQWD